MTHIVASVVGTVANVRTIVIATHVMITHGVSIVTHGIVVSAVDMMIVVTQTVGVTIVGAHIVQNVKTIVIVAIAVAAQMKCIVALVVNIIVAIVVRVTVQQ